MGKVRLQGLGRVLVVEEDTMKANVFLRELRGFSGNRAEAVPFKFLAMIRLAGAEKYNFVLLDGKFVYPATARRMLRQEISKNSDVFGVGADCSGSGAIRLR